MTSGSYTSLTHSVWSPILDREVVRRESGSLVVGWSISETSGVASGGGDHPWEATEGRLGPPESSKAWRRHGKEESPRIAVSVDTSGEGTLWNWPSWTTSSLFPVTKLSRFMGLSQLSCWSPLLGDLKDDFSISYVFCGLFSSKVLFNFSFLHFLFSYKLGCHGITLKVITAKVGVNIKIQ